MHSRKVTLLTTHELKKAEEAIIRYVQWRAFPEETSAPVKKCSPLSRLSPRSDDGTLTVGGRLTRAGMPELTRILPKRGHITDMIVRDMHKKTGHQGREHVLAA